MEADTLKGYHVQVTARSDRDLTPESIIKKVADASGSNYSGDSPAITVSGPPAPNSSKPAFTPTKSSASGAGFNPLAGSRIRPSAPKDSIVDVDGWGQDAPPVTRTQLEKVQPSYQPTKVNMRELSSQKPEFPRFDGSRNDNNSAIGNSDVVKGGYQPVGKVDIAALRRQAQEKHNDRPTTVKGSYEPVGKVDIAAIRARAQQPSEGTASPRSSMSPAVTGSPSHGNDQDGARNSLPDRSAPSLMSERSTFLPESKVTNRHGSSTTSFTGTKAPTPSGFGFESKQNPAAPPSGVGRTFADRGGRTPAQLWAEKKALEQGLRGAADDPPLNTGNSAAPIPSQSPGEWKSGYGGKSWAPVRTTRAEQSASSLEQQRTTQVEEEEAANEGVGSSPTGGVEAMRDRFRDAAPMGAASKGSGASAPSPPPLHTSSKPNAGRGIPIPGLPTRPSQPQDEELPLPGLPTPPAQPSRSPSPPTPPATDPGSPIRVAIPVGRGHNEQEVEDAHEEQFSPPPSMPARSLAQAVPHEEDLIEEPTGYDPARGAGEATVAIAFSQHAAEPAHLVANETGRRALVQYDYKKAEDNELEMREGEYVTNIEMVDDNWWMGQNPRGESGLFPSVYVELVEGDADDGGQSSHQASANLQPEPGTEKPYSGSGPTSQGATAIALYDYEAAEGNELSFPEDARITSVVSLSMCKAVMFTNVQ